MRFGTSIINEVAARHSLFRKIEIDIPLRTDIQSNPPFFLANYRQQALGKDDFHGDFLACKDTGGVWERDAREIWKGTRAVLQELLDADDGSALNMH
jgi:hypothetical protein